MKIKKVSILLTLFTFGLTTQGWANSVKSMNNASNQIKTIKLDENNVNGQKKNGSVKGLFKTTKKRETGFHSAVPYSYDGAIMVSPEPDVYPVLNFSETLNPNGIILKCYPDVEQWGIISNGVNFLKNLEEKKRLQLVDSLDKAISSYKFSQNTWRNNFFNFYEVPKIKPSNSDLGQSALRPHSDENISFEEGRLLTTFKSLQSKKEEIYKELFKEIFMGFRLSFAPMSGHIFWEMNSSPSSEKGPGFIIPF